MVSVKLKWNGKVFENVAVDPTAGATALKETLNSLTGVPIERQKVMGKGLWKGTLKDDCDLATFTWKENMLIAMMGSSEGIPAPPVQQTVFMEDLSTKEKQKVAQVDPPGLTNLGNTCYMNATVQCLKAVPELRDALEASSLNPSSADVGEKMTFVLRQLYNEMDNNDDEVTPAQFVQAMRLTFPQFAQQSAKGGYAQQDADEFFNELMQVLSNKLPTAGPNFPLEGKKDAITALFGIEMSTEMKCMESDDEPVTKGSDVERRLVCSIDSETLTLEQGIKNGMDSEVEKQSTVLGRNALFKTTRRIRKLPKYLAVQENRFFWKRTPESRDHQGVNCKILKSVKFNSEIDVFDLCDSDLQAVLKGPRDEYLESKMASAKTHQGKTDPETAKVLGNEEKGAAEVAANTSGDGDGDGDVDMEDAELQAALKMSMEEGTAAGGSPGIGLPPKFCGNYELFALVTHKGRSADSGHYLGWVKHGKGDDWVCFDDETASYCKESDILLLSGGGDRDMAYLMFYRPATSTEPAPAKKN